MIEAPKNVINFIK